MNRQELTQQLIDRRKYKTYLEIGVFGANNFFPIKCAKKIAVDPEFKFNWKGRLGATLRNASNVNASFFEVTSDLFFEQHAPKIFRNRKLDIALVDGMHEFDYALRDVLNCLKYLADDGVVVMHDCNPATEEASGSFEEWKRSKGCTGFWNGDVWKVITYLKDSRPDLNVFVADCDHGLGIITRSRRQGIRGEFSSIEKVRALTYKDLSSRRKELLNLQSEDCLDDFIKKIPLA